MKLNDMLGNEVSMEDMELVDITSEVERGTTTRRRPRIRIPGSSSGSVSTPTPTYVIGTLSYNDTSKAYIIDKYVITNADKFSILKYVIGKKIAVFGKIGTNTIEAQEIYIEPDLLLNALKEADNWHNKYKTASYWGGIYKHSRDMFQKLLEKQGYKVSYQKDGTPLLTRVAETKPHPIGCSYISIQGKTYATCAGAYIKDINDIAKDFGNFLNESYTALAKTKAPTITRTYLETSLLSAVSLGALGIIPIAKYIEGRRTSELRDLFNKLNNAYKKVLSRLPKPDMSISFDKASIEIDNAISILQSFDKTIGNIRKDVARGVRDTAQAIRDQYSRQVLDKVYEVRNRFKEYMRIKEVREDLTKQPI